jgi:hypothetical protein
MDQFIRNLEAAIKTLKLPLILFIFVIGMGSVAWNVFVGGQDKRSLVTTLLSLMAVAGILFYAEAILKWISRFV